MRNVCCVRWLACLIVGMCTMGSLAQNSKKVKALKRQKTELQDKLRKSQQELKETKKKVKSGQRDIQVIDRKLDDRLTHIRSLETEMAELDKQNVRLQKNISRITGQLNEKKRKFRHAVRYARTCKQLTSPMLFVFSAQNFTQLLRRARFAREYALYQRDLGNQILGKQIELLNAQNQLLESKSRKNGLLREVMAQRKQLGEQQVAQRKVVEGLRKKEKGLAGTVKDQQRQLAALDKKIDDLIAYEIEQARKRAEEAARKKAAEEEARRKRQQAAKGKSTAGGKTAAAEKPATSSSSSSTGSTASSRGSWLTPQDKQLNGSFVQNKGRLPVPITGQYMIGNHFGVYNVKGLKNVQLDNKGINYIGKPGARARSVFDGVVTAVFQFGGTKNVLVRHGSYISVYCNLSSTIVSKGQRVSTKDILGTVADDGSGNCVLHFQLRKETSKLNPEVWVGK